MIDIIRAMKAIRNKIPIQRYQNTVAAMMKKNSKCRENIVSKEKKWQTAKQLSSFFSHLLEDRMFHYL